jgi:hypothetical protein
MNNACEIANKIWTETQSLQSSVELVNVSTPQQREIVYLKQCLCHLMTSMLELHLNAIKKKNEENLNKIYAVKVISKQKVNL